MIFTFIMIWFKFKPLSPTLLNMQACSFHFWTCTAIACKNWFCLKLIYWSSAAASFVRSGSPLFGAGVAPAEHQCDSVKRSRASFPFEPGPDSSGIQSPRPASVLKFTNESLLISKSLVFHCPKLVWNETSEQTVQEDGHDGAVTIAASVAWVSFLVHHDDGRMNSHLWKISWEGRSWCAHGHKKGPAAAMVTTCEFCYNS